MEQKTISLDLKQQTLENLIALASDGAKSQKGDQGMFAYVQCTQEIGAQLKKEEEKKGGKECEKKCSNDK